MLNQNFQTVYENMPYSIKGFTTYDSADDFYTIVLNCRLGYESMKKTLRHELKHIFNNDFYSNNNIEEIEINTHKKGVL